MTIPADRYYTRGHEWLTADEPATVGITSYAADALGDVIFVDLPEVGAAVTAGDPCGEVESTKSVSELYAPADGTVVEVNEAVAADPSLVNSDPYGEGWLFRLAVAGGTALLCQPVRTTPAEPAASAAPADGLLCQPPRTTPAGGGELLDAAAYAELVGP